MTTFVQISNLQCRHRSAKAYICNTITTSLSQISYTSSCMNITTNFKHALVHFPPFPIVFRVTFLMVPDPQIQEHLLGIVMSCIRNPIGYLSFYNLAITYEAHRQGGSRGFAWTPLLISKRFHIGSTTLTVHFKCPAI